MAKELTLLLRIKNDMQVGLAKAKSSLESFGAGAAKVGAAVGAALAKAGAALGASMTAAAYRAQEFNKQLAQVATLSNMSMRQASDGVRRLSSELGLAKDELTKGLYDALSAGVPESNVFSFLETAAKTAKAGATSTTSAVDFLTSAINAFKIPVEDADKVADTLFATVRIGKTTVEELGASFSAVGPLASASGVAFEEVMAAAASLTKQGTPTAQAMTQVRAALVAMNKTLGDGWAATMTFQEGVNEMAKRANGSQVALREMTGRIEGMQAILGLTGQNALMAAQDLEAVTNSSGAMGEAFEKVEKAAPFDRFKQSLDNVVITVGEVLLSGLSEYIEDAAVKANDFAVAIAKWGDEGNVQRTAFIWEGFFSDLFLGAQRVQFGFGLLFGFIADGFKYLDGIKTAFAGEFTRVFRNIGEAGALAAQAITKPWSVSFSDLREMQNRFAEEARQGAENFAEAVKGTAVRQNSSIKSVIENWQTALEDHSARAIESQSKYNAGINEHFDRLAADNARMLATRESDQAAALAKMADNERQQADVAISEMERVAAAAKTVAEQAAANFEAGMAKRYQSTVEAANRASDQIARAGTGAMQQISQAADQSSQSVQNAARQKAATESNVTQQMTSANQQASASTSSTWRSAADDFENTENRRADKARQSANEIADANVRAAATVRSAWAGAGGGGGGSSTFQLGRMWGGGSFVSAGSNTSSTTPAASNLTSASMNNLGPDIGRVATGISTLTQEVRLTNRILEQIRENEENLLRLS